MTIHVISVNKGKKGGSKLFTKVWGLKLVHFWDRTTFVYVTWQQSINMAGFRGEKLCNLNCNPDHTTNLLPRVEKLRRCLSLHAFVFLRDPTKVLDKWSSFSALSSDNLQNYMEVYVIFSVILPQYQCR